MKSTWHRALFKATVLTLALTSSVALVTAQTPEDLTQKSLEDLMNIEVASVYSASKYSQKVTEAPSSVSIVTAEQIQLHGYRTLAEILSSVRGFYVSNDRNYTYVGVRGFSRPGDYNTRILLLIDGHRINDNVYDQALLGRELPIEIDLIERVEIVRGPSSSLYGTSAFFAVINVITKRGRDVKAFEISTEVASLGTYKARLSYGRKLSENTEVLLSGSYYDSKGRRRLHFKEFDTPATNNGVAESLDAEKSESFLANISFREFTLHGTYGSREKSIPTGSFRTIFNDPRARTKDRRGYLDVKYEHTFSNQLELLSRVSYDSYRYDGIYIYDFSEDSTPQPIVNRDNSRGRWWSGELQVSKTMRRHRLTLGTEYRDNLTQNQSNYYVDAPIPSPVLDDRRKSKNWAFFAQDEFRIRENLTLSAGARYDHHTTFGGNLKPRVALIYHPGAKSTIKLLYGEAFRAPNFYELYYYPSAKLTSSKLKPETITTGELVFEKYLGDHLRVSASGYVYRLKGLITQQADLEGRITFNNQERIASSGLEFEIEGKLASGVEGNVAYTLQQTRDRDTRQNLTNSPRHLGKLNLTAPLLKRSVFAGFQFQYSSPRLTLNGTNLPPLYLTNLTLFSKKLAKGLDTSFGAYNLFNQKYADPGSEEHLQNSIEQNGRNFALKFTYHF